MARERQSHEVKAKFSFSKRLPPSTPSIQINDYKIKTIPSTPDVQQAVLRFNLFQVTDESEIAKTMLLGRAETESKMLLAFFIVSWQILCTFHGSNRQ